MKNVKGFLFGGGSVEKIFELVQRAAQDVDKFPVRRYTSEKCWCQARRLHELPLSHPKQDWGNVLGEFAWSRTRLSLKRLKATRPKIFTVVSIAVLVFSFAASPSLGGDPVYFGAPVMGHWDSGKKRSMVEGRFGYMWAANEIRLRDGDNGNLFPSNRHVSSDGLLFGLQGETFVLDDLAVRVQGWINVPWQNRSNWNVDQRAMSWDTWGQYVAADLAAIYHFGLGGMPYAAGLVAGYRYNNFNYESKTVGQPAGTAEDHFHVHIPYLGVYYADSAMFGSVVRLDIFASPFALTRLDGQRRGQGTTVTNIEGHSITGVWFESYFQWSWAVSRSALVGAFAKYNYLQLSGGATEVGASAIQAQTGSTRFSLDSWHHLFMTGISVTYTF